MKFTHDYHSEDIFVVLPHLSGGQNAPISTDEAEIGPKKKKKQWWQVTPDHKPSKTGGGSFEKS